MSGTGERECEREIPAARPSVGGHGVIGTEEKRPGEVMKEMRRRTSFADKHGLNLGFLHRVVRGILAQRSARERGAESSQSGCSREEA
eukprot:6182690-Pleurochrysis_carterae.AAC.2